MSVERLTRLFEALGSPASKNPSIVNVSEQKAATDASPAVRLASDFGTQSAQRRTVRATRVDRLKGDEEGWISMSDSNYDQIYRRFNKLM